MSVTVIDAPCGSGKTSWAIQEINRNRENNYIICTPFLDEITRYREQCPGRGIVEPVNYDTTKIDDFNSKLEAGENICVTHSTFLNATSETIDYIRDGNYHLVLDEALDVVTEFNKTGLVEGDIRQSVNKADLEDILLGKNMIQVNPDTRQVIWIDRSCHDGKFSAVERMAKNGRLYLVRGKLLVCVFPPEMFHAFKSVTAMTYLFNGSQMKAYFDLYNIPYSLASVSNGDGGYSLCDHNDEADRAFRETIRPMITVVDNAGMNFEFSLTKSWYMDTKRRTRERTKQLKSHITHFFKNVAHASASKEEIMWTCPAEFENVISGDRYTTAKKLDPQSEEHRELLDGAKKAGEYRKHLRCFVPCNSKGTNIYRFRWALAYCADISYNSMAKGFFTDDNEKRRAAGLPCVELDNDALALSCFIQWLFRSRIRDGKPVSVYIPSKRIRELFLDWLNS